MVGVEAFISAACCPVCQVEAVGKLPAVDVFGQRCTGIGLQCNGILRQDLDRERFGGACAIALPGGGKAGILRLPVSGNFPICGYGAARPCDMSLSKRSRQRQFPGNGGRDEEILFKIGLLSGYRDYRHNKFLGGRRTIQRNPRCQGNFCLRLWKVYRSVCPKDFWLAGRPGNACPVKLCGEVKLGL